MNEEQYKQLVEKLGKELADKFKAEMEAFEKKAKEIAALAVKNGGITAEQFEEYKAAETKARGEIEELCRKQGITITELSAKLEAAPRKIKTVAEVLRENESKLKEVFYNGQGVMRFMLQADKEGNVYMRPLTTKAAGPHATIDDVGHGDNVTSVTQSVDAASLLRLGGNAPIVGQYRNTPWVFDLVNLINVGADSKLAMWWEEQAKDGASTTVAEGATKPPVQYKYDLKSSPYKKEAQLVQFTDEFAMDFDSLESDILGKARVDLLNRVNSAVLTNIIGNATAYNTSTSFGQVDDVNDFDAIAAMAAQVDNATKGNAANAALMSTFKKYRMGVEKSAMAGYLNPPEVLNGIRFVGNSDMAADAVVVGDLKNYNVQLRGGMIVRVGYNGTDFAENRFSVVLEQFYFDYIATIRKAAIVKGPDFTTVKSAIGGSVSS